MIKPLLRNQVVSIWLDGWDIASAVDSWPEGIHVERDANPAAADNPSAGFGAGRNYDIIPDANLKGEDPLSRLAVKFRAFIHFQLAALPLDTRHTSACAKRYRNGGHQGWHRDGNDITALLYLNTPAAGGGTLIQGEEGIERIHPERGKCILFHGRAIMHAAEACPDEKLVLILNLYRPSTYESRPPGLDAVILGM